MVMFYNYFKLLRQKNFFLLLFAQIISQFGDKLTQIALIGLVSTISNSSKSLAMITSMTIIPVFIFSFISGVYVDRWNKKNTMAVCEFLRGLCTILLLFSVKLPLLIIYIIVFFSFSIGRFFLPAKMAIIPNIIKKEDIFLANSLISITATVSSIFGIGLGGIIVENLGLKPAFLIDIFTFFISALAISFIFIKEDTIFLKEDILKITKDITSNFKSSFTKDLKEAIFYIQKTPQTRYIFRTFFFLFICCGIFPVFTKFIQDILNSSTKDIGFIGVFLGVGIFFGSLLYGRIAHRFSIKRVLDFSLMFSLIYFLFFINILNKFPSRTLAILFSFFLGLFISPIFVGASSMIHKESSYNFLGRIFSALEFIAHLGFIISMFIFSFLADFFGHFTIMLVFGIISSIFAIIFFIYDYKGIQRTAA